MEFRLKLWRENNNYTINILFQGGGGYGGDGDKGHVDAIDPRRLVAADDLVAHTADGHHRHQREHAQIQRAVWRFFVVWCGVVVAGTGHDLTAHVAAMVSKERMRLIIRRKVRMRIA